MSKHPRPYNPSDLDALRDQVPDRTFRRFDGPNGLKAIVQDSGQERLRCTVVASSNFASGDNLPLSENTPQGQVVLVRRYRYCKHDGSPHFNADSQVLWTDQQGRAWQASTNRDSDHYMYVVSGTDLSGIADAYQLPEMTSGSLEQFRKGGAYLDFSPDCRKKSEK